MLDVDLPVETELSQLAELLYQHLPNLDPSTFKFINRGKAYRPVSKVTLKDMGVKNGSKVKLVASSKKAVNSVVHARDLPAMAGFDHEERREVLRQSPPQASAPAGANYFGQFQTWNYPGLQPPPSEALKLLHRLSSDPGILYLMNHYKWKVGVLSEMPPEGKVGVSPVCILGVNINKGQEITLRLRTDDLKGFRQYDRIKETLIHELAHMVWGDHDNNFKEFNSKLRRQAQAADWTAPGARMVSGQAAAIAPTLAGQVLTPAGTSSRKLAGNGAAPGVSAKVAAAEAALRRAGRNAAGPASYPVEVNEAPSPPPSPLASTVPLKKGDACLYRQRDGTWVAAKVAAVDVSVQPPSYGIELPGADGTPSYRETEGDRLRHAPPPPPAGGDVGEDDGIEGLGHFDPATEAKEAELQRLEQL